MALARLLTAIATSFIVGIILFAIFDRNIATEENFASGGKIMERKAIYLLILLILSLLLPNYLGVGKSYEFKVAIFAILIAITLFYAFKSFGREDLKLWFTETLFFVKQIIPLLLIGVFFVGIIGELLKETELVSTYLGGEGIQQSFIAAIIGALSYFATLTEAPFVEMLMDLGMGKGAAVALLLAGPGLSLPNMLAISRLFGVKRAVVYILTIISIASFAGWFLGGDRMEIKVVGPGCARCKATLELVRKVVEKEKVDADVEYITDMRKAIDLGVMATPAVIVDGKIVVQGRIPSESEIAKALRK